jgi:Acetoacetate decarboxylase (ADC)
MLGHLQTTHQLPIPTSPWVVQGSALIVIGRLPYRSAHALAGQVSGMQILPGIGSIAALGCVNYTRTPVGPYHELVVSPGILWRVLPGFLISHMPVDSEIARLSGRALWGLPKTLETITWNESTTCMECSLAGAPPPIMIRAEMKGSRPSLLVPILPGISARGPRYQLFTVAGRLGRVRAAHVTITTPPDSPYAPVAALTRGPHVSLWIGSFTLQIGTPLELS